MEIRSKAIQRIELNGKPKVIGVCGCKTYRKALQVLIGKHYKQRNTELEFYTKGLLELYNKFHPEKVTEGEIKGWKGKSGITNIEKLPDRIILTRFQRPTKDEEPKEVNIEIQKEELEAVLNILNKLQINETIETKYLAMGYSERLELGHKNWKDFFADRRQHNLLTNILGYLDSEEIIRYRGGKSTLIRKELNFQAMLLL